MNATMDGRARESTTPDVRKLDLAAGEHISMEAQRAMEAIAASFARSARRSLPFLARFKGRIGPRPVEIAARDQEVAGLEAPPLFTAHLAGGVGAWATVTLTAQAIVMILEGSMGGRGAASSAGLAPQLTVAQRALVARIARSLAGDFAAAAREIGKLELTPVPDGARACSTGAFLAPELVGARDASSASSRRGPLTAKAATGLRVVCDVDGFGQGGAAIVVTIGAEALEDVVRETTARVALTGDSRIGDALPEVSLELVAELGRIPLGLRRVLSLKPGDVIRLPTAVDDAIAVRIEGTEKFAAVPITSRGQLAVEIKARHGT